MRTSSGNIPTSPKSVAFRAKMRLPVLAAAAIIAAATTMSVPAVAFEGHGGGGHSGHSGGSFSHAASGSVGHSGSGFHGSYGHASAFSGHAGAGFRGSYGRGFGGRGYYGGWRGFRPYGPAFAGYGFFYDYWAAWPFLGLAAWELADYSYLSEAEVRNQENAVVDATSAPINEPIVWNDGTASGSVTPLRDGRTADGRSCREFQQQVTVDGQTQHAIGTACQQPDGSWQIINEGT